MQWKNTTSTYGLVHKTIHWLMGLLLILQISLGWIFTKLPNDAGWRSLGYHWHAGLGVSLFALVLVRLLWRKTNPTVSRHSRVSRQAQLAATVMHHNLYLMMLLMPLTGYLHATAKHGRPLVFWVVSIPAALVNQGIATLAETLHYWVGWGFLICILLHASAAVQHALVSRSSNVLKRMWY